MELKDITIFYPLKCNGKYEPFAYSFRGSVNSFTDGKEAFNFIKDSFLTEKECQDKCDMLNNLQN